MEYVTVAKVGEVAVGRAKVVLAGAKRIALCNVEGKVYAIGDVCTHDDGPLGEGELFGNQIECPRHGARFDVTTGQAKILPAVVPVPFYPVKIEGDDIQVGL